MKIKIINKSTNDLPAYKTPGSAGMDIRAFLKEPLKLKVGDIALVPTGLYLEIPDGYEVQVRARSGLSLKNGITLANGIGTIDSDYRGELGVILINLGKEDFVINNGDRIAQMVAIKYEKVQIEEVLELEETQRADGGFGSSGIK
ncbi:dUTP diphosphatase [Neofamilia massiliensis]|uniref:dUTP diphosphatase n=1 Tax=Neofamilia massiliensis TaxID=1673724 RepID=UPI0006BB8CF3|nr:dUTP diphosphatase [Neofamilia massiliensis]